MSLQIFRWQDNGWWRGILRFTAGSGRIIVIDLGAFTEKEPLDAMADSYINFYMEKTKI